MKQFIDNVLATLAGLIIVAVTVMAIMAELGWRW